MFDLPVIIINFAPGKTLNMKKILAITIFLSLLSYAAHAQKLTRISKDSVSGISILESDYSPLSQHFGCRLRAVNATLFFEAAMIGGEDIYEVKAGAPFILEIRDGRKILMENIQPVNSEYFTISMCDDCVERLELKLKMEMGREQLYVLQKHPVTKVTFLTSGGTVERVVDPKDARKLRKMFNLIQ